MQRALLSLAVVALFFYGGQAKADLVVNGGFEDNPNETRNDQSPTGWTFTAGNGTNAPTSGTNAGAGAHSGNWYYQFGSNGTTPDTLSQNVPTSSGGTYTLSYYLSYSVDSTNNSPAAEFTASWDGQVLSDLTPSTNSDGYSQYTFQVTGSSTGGNPAGTKTGLAFTGMNTSGFFNLDDVSVTASSATVPEPSSFALLGMSATGMFAFGGWRWRRKNAAVPDVVPAKQV